eukprot:gene1642-1010_t
MLKIRHLCKEGKGADAHALFCIHYYDYYYYNYYYFVDYLFVVAFRKQEAEKKYAEESWSEGVLSSTRCQLEQPAIRNVLEKNIEPLISSVSVYGAGPPRIAVVLPIGVLHFVVGFSWCCFSCFHFFLFFPFFFFVLHYQYVQLCQEGKKNLPAQHANSTREMEIKEKEVRGD